MEAGIQYIHVVDLDGALEGRAANRDLIAKIKEMTGLAIEGREETHHKALLGVVDEGDRIEGQEDEEDKA